MKKYMITKMPAIKNKCAEGLGCPFAGLPINRMSMFSNIITFFCFYRAKIGKKMVCSMANSACAVGFVLWVVVY